MPGCEIVEQNIQLDHIHMLMIIPPKYAVSEVSRGDEAVYSEQAKGKVCMAGEGVLERTSSVVSWLLCFHCWDG